MDKERLQLQFFLLLLLGALVVVFLIFKPYLTILFLAATAALAFAPLYRKTRRYTGGHDAVAAGLVTVVLFIAVITPLILIGIQLFKEASSLYIAYATESPGYTLEYIGARITEKIGTFGVPVTFDAASYARGTFAWITGNLGVLFGSIVKIMIELFLFTLGFFFFLKDGEHLKGTLTRLSPLKDSYDREIFKRLEISVNSVIKGTILVGLARGVLAGIGFFIFGVPNPVLWGVIAAAAALIPNIGPALVFIFAVIYVFLAHGIPTAIGLGIWSLIVTLVIDNILTSKIIGRDIKTHPFLILLSVFGGISLFGLVGFIMGPVLLTLFLALLDIYSTLLSGNPPALLPPPRTRHKKLA